MKAAPRHGPLLDVDEGSEGFTDRWRQGFPECDRECAGRQLTVDRRPACDARARGVVATCRRDRELGREMESAGPSEVQDVGIDVRACLQ